MTTTMKPAVYWVSPAPGKCDLCGGRYRTGSSTVARSTARGPACARAATSSAATAWGPAAASATSGWLGASGSSRWRAELMDGGLLIIIVVLLCVMVKMAIDS